MQTVIDGLLVNYLRVNHQAKHHLLILHGWGHSGSYWQDILTQLPPEVSGIALDLPAFGSTQPLPDTAGVPEYATFVKKFIDKLKLSQPTLLGHSFGGQVAVDLSLSYPQVIKHLILVSPACIRNDRPIPRSRLGSLLRPLYLFLPQGLRHLAVEKFASQSYSGSNPKQRSILKKILHQDYSQRLNEITIPTSIIWGSEDREIPYKGNFLAEKIKSSSLYVLYGADHNPHLSAPLKLLDTLKNILEKVYV